MHKKPDLVLQTGAFLLAEPFMEDLHFQRAVLLLCDHHETEGSVGFILNKPMSMQVGILIEDLADFKAEVFYGGPVQQDTLHYLHTKGDLIQNSLPVMGNLYWGGNFEEVKFCIKNGLIGAHEIRFVVGYAGWDPKQLEEEIAEKSWLVAEGDLNHVFKPQPKDMWRPCLENAGGHYAVIAQMDKPCFN